VVIVEMADLTFMDCSGYGAFVAARQVLEERSGSLTLANSTGEPAYLLSLIDTFDDPRWDAQSPTLS
jgi:anti-anti-sigma factor